MPKHAIPPRREILPPERREEFVLRSPTAEHLIQCRSTTTHGHVTATGSTPKSNRHPIQNPELCTRRTTRMTHPGACRTARSWRVRPECARHPRQRGVSAGRGTCPRAARGRSGSGGREGSAGTGRGGPGPHLAAHAVADAVGLLVPVVPGLRHRGAPTRQEEAPPAPERTNPTEMPGRRERRNPPLGRTRRAGAAAPMARRSSPGRGWVAPAPAIARPGGARRGGTPAAGALPARWLSTARRGSRHHAADGGSGALGPARGGD